jgi:hypothetical protein
MWHSARVVVYRDVSDTQHIVVFFVLNKTETIVRT